MTFAGKTAQGEANCPICGSDIIQPAKGRPRRFCSPECRELAAIISQFSSWLNLVSEHCTPEAQKRIYGDMWSAMNSNLNRYWPRKRKR